MPAAINAIGTQLRDPINSRLARWRMAVEINEWAPPRNSGGIPYVSTRFSLSMEMSRLTLDVTAEPVSRDQILRRERGQEKNTVSCSADHEKDCQPYPVDPLLHVMTIHAIQHHPLWEKHLKKSPAANYFYIYPGTPITAVKF